MSHHGTPDLLGSYNSLCHLKSQVHSYRFASPSDVAIADMGYNSFTALWLIVSHAAIFCAQNSIQYKEVRQSPVSENINAIIPA